MQTLNNKTFQLTNPIIRLPLRVGVILAIIMTSFLVQKQLVYAATNSDNKASVLSSPGPFIKSSPANATTIQTTNPTLSWGASSGATSYQYCINTTASCTAPAAWISTGTSTSVALSGLTQGTKYYWQVRARNNTGITYANGGSTVWWSFTIAPVPAPTRTKVPPPPTPTKTSLPPTPTPTITPVPTQSQDGNTYYVATDGNDANLGTQDQPWQTIQKAVNTLSAGDMVYVRGGQYNGIKNGWIFQNSGTQSQPITLTNYPGEQVIFKMTTVDRNDHQIFVCNINPTQPISWQTPKADYIRIIGTDVLPQVLSNNVESKYGIVIQGIEGEQSAGIIASDCDYWEIAGVDFVEVSSGIFTFKNNWGTMEEHSTDNWYVHDNRVNIFYRESGMQFNGNNNLIVNNEIYKVTNRVDTPYGCQLLNILGNHNTIRGNTLSRAGSAADCSGILFEWDLADENLVEQNLVYDVLKGVDIEGGDNNVIRNNIIYATSTPDQWSGGIEIKSYDNSIKTDWPCNETLGSAQALLPPNNPAHPDYQYYYNPRNCHSYGNQIYNNTIHGFVESIRLYPLAGENTIIRNNIFSGWTRDDICLYNTNGTCNPLPVEVTASNNAAQDFEFIDILHFDFHLTANSPLIDAGYNLGLLNPNTFDGNVRPQGAGYDIGAYEYPVVPGP